jgi:sugar lactone lactonase YvrE
VAVLSACGGSGSNSPAGEGNPNGQNGPATTSERIPLQPPVTATVAAGIYLAAGDIGGSGNLDGLGADARFMVPTFLMRDAQGNMLTVDSNGTMISLLRKITLDGNVSTLRSIPGGPVATDRQGNIFVASNFAILRYSPEGLKSIVAGMESTPGDVDGTGSMARFNNINSMTIDSGGNLYVTDTPASPCPPCIPPAAIIRKITPGGVVTTLAGSLTATDNMDGTGPAAHFRGAGGITFDQTRDALLVSSGGIRKVTLDGVVTTMPVDLTGLAQPEHFTVRSMVADASGAIFVTSGFNAIYRVAPDGHVAELAGSRNAENSDNYGYADGTGPSARFREPSGITVDAEGNAYVADSGNAAIRKVTPSGTVTTLAGLPGSKPPALVDGKAASARFNGARGSATGVDGVHYVADSGNSAVRRIAPNGDVTTLGPAIGSPGFADGPADVARLAYPQAVAVGADGMVFVADQLGGMVRRIAPDGTVTSVAGAFGGYGLADGTGSNARFTSIGAMVADTAGNLYVTDKASVRKVSPGGTVTTLAGNGVPGYSDGPGNAARFGDILGGIVLDAAGNLYVQDYINKAVRRIALDGTVTTVRSNVAGTGPLAMDAGGNFYSAVDDLVLKLAPDGTVTTVAGIPGQLGIRLGNLPGALPIISGLNWAGANVLVVSTHSAVLKLAVP